ncbi:AMP-binding protein [Nocardiopsis dassonvillei]|uniref:AMP-binding protein n=1 Tax=Nocardiopsis dassonvillei TaxID=2014 RepID=UPI00366B6E11
MLNLAHDLSRLCGERGWRDRPACLEDGAVWTHGQVHATAARCAAVLAGRGVGPGDHVLLALPDGAAWVVSFLACARIGAVAVTVNPDLSGREHRYMASDCAPVLVLAEEHLHERFPDVPALTGAALLAEGATRAPAPPVPTGPDAPLYVQYTSGTTGQPKGVVHRCADPASYMELVGRPVADVGPTDVTLSVSKMFFAYGFGNAFVFPLLSGSAAVYTAGRPGAAEVAGLVARHGVTLLYGVPSFYANLVREASPADLASLRLAVSAGERLAPDLGERARGLLGVPLLEQLGSTEAGHGFCSNTVSRDAPGTVGRVLPGFRVRVLDRDGAPVAPGGTGELHVTGPTLMQGYLNLPEDTRRTLPEDGWLRTGDLVTALPSGDLVHRGRTDDLEMVGGITFSPVEVEDLLRSDPRVREAAVTSLPDERGATRLHAFVVPASSADSAETLESELIDGLRGRVAPYKVPRSVRLVPDLPRTPTGKLRRFQLRASLAAASRHDSAQSAPGSPPAGPAPLP